MSRASDILNKLQPVNESKLGWETVANCTHDEFLKEFRKQWPDAMSEKGNTAGQTKYTVGNGNVVGFYDEQEHSGQYKK